MLQLLAKCTLTAVGRGTDPLCVHALLRRHGMSGLRLDADMLCLFPPQSLWYEQLCEFFFSSSLLRETLSNARKSMNNNSDDVCPHTATAQHQYTFSSFTGHTLGTYTGCMPHTRAPFKSVSPLHRHVTKFPLSLRQCYYFERRDAGNWRWLSICPGRKSSCESALTVKSAPETHFVSQCLWNDGG